ncbi:carbamoyltransferase HypF [Roseibium sp. RKSG952]|uniref:carbamoyltransferase HypF n=1 Tax=Roseibium sp. RKSG952 TaxID=2529384 RepID=UPI0012BBA103|nr:carbamoyltransferase HypF [Roseibium sp. RKSG952]MTI00194.1 carbamoyltransferase HypF [Roseibium sp. RKSG952]
MIIRASHGGCNLKGRSSELVTIGRTFRIKGLVQGVGFRPFVWQLARSEGVCGSVRNDAAGVLVEAHGTRAALERFAHRLLQDAPPLSRVDSVESAEIPVLQSGQPTDFIILESRTGQVSTGVVPDTATCLECLRDIRDPQNRRFGYAFTNCTHCGPRLSILKCIPYDRQSTSMAVFEMCPACRSEYETPSDRRFHAQPNACPVCGPGLWFEDGSGTVVEGEPVSLAAKYLQQGAILALQGLGGFQIAVDAGDDEAVRRLRSRKRRPAKPFALMARDLAQVKRYCRVSREEEALLSGTSAPIVLLEQHDLRSLAPGVAPGMDRLGIMLPNTPLHHLLLDRLERPIVLTSGNLSSDPQETGNALARQNLTGLVDGFVMHDREIVNRVDDSLVRVDRTGPAILRRARGLAPAPIRLHEGFAEGPNVLALGGELKSVFGLVRGWDVVLSQHIGDLENLRTYKDFKRTLMVYQDLYDFAPEVIAIDRHPQYLSSRLGRKVARETGASTVEVQHHHAHLAACLAEHNWPLGEAENVLGIILDGTGWGADGSIWGGEFLSGGYEGFERAGHFQPVPLPGGATAVREPWRNLAAHLGAAFGPDYREFLKGTGLEAALDTPDAHMLDRMIAGGVNAPLSSSAGRLFDAVAAALGICFKQQGYEGEAAMRLEALARPYLTMEPGYRFGGQSGGVLSFTGLWVALLEDLKTGTGAGVIAARFHNGLVEAITSMALDLGAKDAPAVVLSGGVFQNAIMKHGVTEALEAAGCRVLLPRQAPANDGGLALGQGAIAAARSLRR